jgi:arylsulfatase A-like enzyme
MTRRNFLTTSLAAGAGAAAAPPARPNIIFILADDLGYGDLGCYGQKRIQTPNLDRMAREGMLFTQAYAGSTVCAPSRCSLMTGKHQGHATVRGNKRPELGLRRGEPTVASLLKQAGYRTALFGKWGLGGPQTGTVPNRVGFDEFFGYLDQLHAHNSFPEHLWENEAEVFLTKNWFNQKQVFAPDLFTERTLSFLERASKDPFFIYLAYTIPHANNELGAIQANGMDSPDHGIYAKENWPDVEKSFAATITRMDSDIGKVMEALRRKGLDENTLVIFTSDNGPHREGNHDPEFFQSRGPLRGMKRDLYEGGIRVPTLARWPARIKPGQRSDFAWAFWDFLPTACELAGVKAPAGLDGISIVPTLLGREQKPHDYLYWEFHEGGFHQAVRQGDWKLVRQKPKFQTELYNLRDDIGETKNLAAQQPALVAKLEKLFTAARVDSPDFPVKPKK